MRSLFGGFDMIFSLVWAIFPVLFIIVIGILILRLIQGANQWRRNNNSPILTVDATVVAKRADVSHYHQADMNNNMGHMNSHTTYYVTFEVASGDRMEFHVSGNEYGMLAEQDFGKLTFQGTRYLGFERQL